MSGRPARRKAHVLMVRRRLARQGLSGAPLLLHVLSYDGSIAGRWRRRPGKKRSATLAVRLSARPTRAQRAALGRTLARFSDFQGEPTDVEILT